MAGEAPASVKRLRWVVSADVVAARILRALERRRQTLYIPRISRLFTLAGAFAPSLMDYYLSRFFAGPGVREPGPIGSGGEALACTESVGFADE
jgi:hypothetical protein